MRGALLAGTVVAIAACSSDSAPRGPPTFGKLTLDMAFRSEGVAIFDVDRDGRDDIVTDQFWYRAPDFAPIPIRAPETYDPATRYSLCSGAYGDDLDHDGFTDLLVVPFPTDAM